MGSHTCTVFLRLLQNIYHLSLYFSVGMGYNFNICETGGLPMKQYFEIVDVMAR